MTCTRTDAHTIDECVDYPDPKPDPADPVELEDVGEFVAGIRWAPGELVEAFGK